MRYNTPNTPMDNMREYVRRSAMPVTLTLLAINVLTFLASFFFTSGPVPDVLSKLVFTSDTVLHTPWTLLTYPLVSFGFSIWMVVTWVFFYLSGGSLERSWGSQRFIIFFLAVTAISAASMFLGSLLTGINVILLNQLFLPLTGLIVAFCMLNPEQPIMLYFIPVRAKYVAIIITAWNFFAFGTEFRSPLIGLFSLGGILVAYLYVRFARPWADIDSYATPRRAPRGPDLRIYPSAGRFSTRTPGPIDGSPGRSPFDLAGRWRDYPERKRLERLWKNSGFSDSEPSWQDDDRRR